MGEYVANVAKRDGAYPNPVSQQNYFLALNQLQSFSEAKEERDFWGFERKRV